MRWGKWQISSTLVVISITVRFVTETWNHSLVPCLYGKIRTLIIIVTYKIQVESHKFRLVYFFFQTNLKSETSQKRYRLSTPKVPFKLEVTCRICEKVIFHLSESACWFRDPYVSSGSKTERSRLDFGGNESNMMFVCSRCVCRHAIGPKQGRFNGFCAYLRWLIVFATFIVVQLSFKYIA